MPVDNMFDLAYLMGKSGHKVIAMKAHLLLNKHVGDLHRWNRWHIPLFSNGVEFIFPTKNGHETLTMLRSENEPWYQFLISLGVEPYDVPTSDPSAFKLVQDATGYIETEERRIGDDILGEIPETILFVFSLTDTVEVTAKNFRLGVALERVDGNIRVIPPEMECTAKDHYGEWASRKFVRKNKVKRGKRR